MSERTSLRRVIHQTSVIAGTILCAAGLALSPAAAAAQRPAGVDTTRVRGPRADGVPRDSGLLSSPPGAPAFELGEIVVSATRPVSEAAAGVQVVDAARLRTHGARTLDEALALVPGMDVRTGGEGIPRVGFRGFRPRHLLVLLDGVPLNSTFDGQPDLSLIPADRIAYVKVTGATASVLYGEALGGVVEVVTRDGAPGVRGEAGAELRSGPAHSGRLAASGGTGALRFFAAAAGSATDAFPALPLVAGDALARSNSARDWSSAFGTVTLGGTRARAALLLSGVHASYGIPPIAVTDTSDSFASRPAYQRVERLAGGAAQLSAAFDIAPRLTLRGWAFLNAQDERDARFDDSTYSGMTNPAVKGTYLENTRNRLGGAGAQARWSVSPLARVTFALSGERDGWSLAGVIRDSALSSGTGGGGGGKGGGGGGGGGTGSSWAIRSLADQRALRRFSVATELELTPLARLGFVLGGGWQGLARDSGGTTSTGAFAAGATWDASAGTRFRISAARKVRFPAIRQLYDPDGGNPTLSPERATELDLGADQRLSPRATARISLFRADVRGYIDRASSGAPFTNRGLLRFEGVEGMLRTRPAGDLALDGSVAYLQTRDRSPGANGREQQYTPRIRALLQGRWQAPGDISAAVSLARVLHQVYYSRQAPVLVGRLPDYTLLGLRLARPLPGHARVYVGGENLLDARYYDQYGFPRPARLGYGGLSLAL